MLMGKYYRTSRMNLVMDLPLLKITFIVAYLTTPIAANYQYTSVEVRHQTLHGDINFLSPASTFLVVY